MPQSLINILTYAGIIIVALVTIGIILTRLYRRATKDVALIRTGFGGEKVVLNGGVMVIPVLHELMQVRLTTVKLEVSRLNKDALITLDKLRVDVVGLFHIKVKPDAQSIAAAAQTLGDSVNSPDAVKSLLDGKLVSALRSVAATMTMEHLHANRADFIQKVQEALMTDLDMNGFQLESVSITHFDQTAFEHFNENNAFDAEGLTVLTRTIEERKKIRNDIVATNRVEIEQRNLDANNQSLDIAQAAEQARLTQEQTLSARRAEQATAIATAEAEQTRLAEIARISAEQAQTVAQTEADKVIQTATIARDGAVQTATIERDRNIELARITTAVQTAQKSEEESTATAAANEARAHRRPGRGKRRDRQGDRDRQPQQERRGDRGHPARAGRSGPDHRRRIGRKGGRRSPRRRAADRGDCGGRCRKGPCRGPGRGVLGGRRGSDRAQRGNQRAQRRADRAAGAPRDPRGVARDHCRCRQADGADRSHLDRRCARPPRRAGRVGRGR